MKDLRTYLDGNTPKLAVRRPVRCAHELAGVLALMETSGRHEAAIFENVVDDQGRSSRFRVVSNLFARQESIRALLSAAGMDDIEAFNARVAVDGRWEVIERAPVKQHLLLDDQVDLRELPVVTHHEHDAGPYLTSGIVIVKDPDTGIHNAAIQRLQVQSPRRLGVFMVPTGQTKTIQRKYEARGQDMPVAVVVGHHPLFYLGAQTKEPIDRDEYRIIASLFGEPLRLTPGVTRPDLLIPADAELVLEGTVPAAQRRLEGPFAEYTHYYSDRGEREFINVNAVLHRQDPLMLDIFACHRDHHLLEGTLMTAQLSGLLRRQQPEFVRLSLPLSGCCQFYCYVSLRRRPDTSIAELGRQLLKAQEYIKYVVIVDDDVDVDNEPEVLWAVATRATLSRDLHLFRDGAGTSMDPNSQGADGPERGVLDATAKSREARVGRVRVKPDATNGRTLDDYL
jgi:2,5-furandicarboxylate decarboxylase 1